MRIEESGYSSQNGTVDAHLLLLVNDTTCPFTSSAMWHRQPNFCVWGAKTHFAKIDCFFQAEIYEICLGVFRSLLLRKTHTHRFDKMHRRKPPNDNNREEHARFQHCCCCRCCTNVKKKERERKYASGISIPCVTEYRYGYRSDSDAVPMNGNYAHVGHWVAVVPPFIHSTLIFFRISTY